MMRTSNKLTLLEPFQCVQNKSKIATRNNYIYYLAGYPVSGKNIGHISGFRISSQISIRYNPSLVTVTPPPKKN